MKIASFVVLGLGVVLVIIGTLMLAFEWWKRQRGGHPGVETAPTGAADQMNALRKLLKELRRHPLGTQLIAWGILLILIGGALGGISTL